VKARGKTVRRIVIGLAVALCAAAVSSCGGDGEQTFTENDRTVEVRAEDRFRIELPANPGVGDDWSLAEQPDPAVVQLVEDGFVSDADEELVGAPGVEYFLFEAIAPGETEIAFDYCYRGCGSAEGEPLERTVTFDVTVS
jgi:predicted secreted protein